MGYNRQKFGALLQIIGIFKSIIGSNLAYYQFLFLHESVDEFPLEGLKQSSYPSGCGMLSQVLIEQGERH